MDQRERRFVGICGIYCGACALGNGEMAAAAKNLRRFVDAYDYLQKICGELNWPEFMKVLHFLADGSCPGCGAGGGNPFCKVRNCAKEKNVSLCEECSEFPCQRIYGFQQTYPFAVTSLQRRKEVGIEEWLKQEQEKAAKGHDIELSYDKKWTEALRKTSERG